MYSILGVFEGYHVLFVEFGIPIGQGRNFGLQSMGILVFRKELRKENVWGQIFCKELWGQRINFGLQCIENYGFHKEIRNLEQNDTTGYQCDNGLTSNHSKVNF